jgi:hypothetical protein
LTNTVAVGIALAAAAAVLAFSRRRGDEPDAVADQSMEEALRDYDLELVPVPAGEVRD